MRPLLTTLAFASLLCGCGFPSPQDFDEQRRNAVETDVRAFTSVLASDLADRGPLAWLDHFDHGPEFFMASDGVELFPDYATADSIVRGFAPELESIHLVLEDLDIYPVGPDMALFGSPYSEALRDTSGAIMSIGGYVTGTVVRTTDRWLVRNLHWSSAVPTPDH